MMHMSPNGFTVVRYFEDCKLTAYPDPKTGGDPWTIGFGATGPGITRGTKWTQQQADARLMQDVGQREDMANGSVLVSLTRGQADAFISILFNVGPGAPKRDGILRLKTGEPSTLLRRVNAGQFALARAEFAKWISPGSDVERGLKRRRRAEQALWDGMSGNDAIGIAVA